MRILRQFGRDESGLAMVLVAIMLPVIIGFALLVIDGSRAGNLHNDTQRGADALAMAGAAELDARPDAWTRAERAMENLVHNQTRFSDEDDGGTDNFYDIAVTGTMTVDATNSACRSRGAISWCFLEDIPTSDASPITSANYAIDPVSTMFIQVIVEPQDFTTIFPATFLGGSNSMTIGSEAVAGFGGVVTCDMTPLMICNPFPGQNLQDVANNQNFYRKGIKLVMGSTSWGPGNMGFLRPEDAHGYGEGDLADDIARVSFPECVNSRGIYTQTGNLTEKAKAAFNTRFDMYGPHFPKTDATVPPAPNIRKGFDFKPRNPSTPGTDPCDKQPGTDLTQFRSLTQDTAYPLFDGRIGNGLWDYQGYKDANYPDGELDGFVDEDLQAYDNLNPPSRYDLYKYEIENDLVDDTSVGGETGEALCHATPSTDPDRRLVYAAIVDCDLYEDQLNGQSGTLQAMAFASFFLTEPVMDDMVYAEIVDIDGNKGRGTMIDFAKDEVQLYR